MTELNTHRMTAAFGAFVALEAVTFLVAALLHLGVQISLGIATLTEPVILPAAVVEGLIGLFLAISAYALFTRRSWARFLTTAAHIFGTLGVLLGMYALAAGFGPRSEANDIYHRVMLVALLAGVIVLATPKVKTALGGGTG